MIYENVDKVMYLKSRLIVKFMLGRKRKKEMKVRFCMYFLIVFYDLMEK